MMDCKAKNKSILTNIEKPETNKNLEVSNVRKSYLLPKKMSPNKEAFINVGFTFEKCTLKDKIKVYLPENWTIKEENGVLRYFYDQKNRLRGEILHEYKSLYCDFKGEICLRRRFHPSYIYKNKNYVNSVVIVFIEDTDGKMVLKIGECRNVFDCKEFDELMTKAKEYLNRNYPDWKNPSSYWD